MGLQKYNTNNIIEKFLQIHGEKYSYEKFIYIGHACKSEIICNIHGSFFQRAADHLNGHGCKLCMCDKLKKDRTKYSEASIIKDFQKIHGDNYDYSNLQYVAIKEKCNIICKIHGSFQQVAYDHKRGHGCMRCTNKGVISKNWFSWNKPKAISRSFLYLMEFQDSDEKFFKIGLSANPKNRKQKYGTAYKRKLVHTISGKLIDIYNLEQYFLTNLLIKNIYRPKIDIKGGNTECFKADEKLITEIINIMNSKEIQWNKDNEIKFTN